MHPEDKFEADRIKKLERIRQLGHDPWGGRFDGRISIAEARNRSGNREGQTGEPVRVAGRIMLSRDMGRLKFLHLQDWTGRIQLALGKKQLSDADWQVVECLDLGDLIGVDGPVGRTRTGEITIFAQKLHFLTKAVSQPPEKFHGLADVELRQRQRSLDLIHNPEVLERFQKRIRIIDAVRGILRSRGFVEAETPVLHAIAGGAAARPFVTHHNALDLDLYLRIALELHLKRLLVGGIERVYELGRVFRNEGIDARHNPEFTMLEAYEAYGNYETMMDLTEGLIVAAVEAVGQGMKLPWGDAEIDFTPPWPRRSYAELFAEHAGVSMHDAAAVAAKAREHGIEPENKHPDVLVNEVFEAVVEDRLTGPLFSIDYPASICPLTKRKRGDDRFAERFELFVQGMEIANAYTELNDPYLQEQLFRTQLAGLPEEESMARMDEDFIRALKVGMPPAGGLGIGIDRLVMLLTNAQTIRDVILFPLLRPRPGE